MLSLTTPSNLPLSRQKVHHSTRFSRANTEASHAKHEDLVYHPPVPSFVRRGTQLAAAAVAVVAIYAVSPAVAIESNLEEPSAAANTSSHTTNRPKMNCPRPTLKSVQPEDSTADTRLGRASEAATHEMRVRAAMFDDAVTRTNDVKRRTQGFVKNMWQSLE